MHKEKFKNIKIINLAFEPFGPGPQLEIKILNHISNSIIQIEKEIRRKLGVVHSSKDFNFERSKTIIAIDVSTLVSRETSYIDNLYGVINLYPFILINSSINSKRLKAQLMHKSLKEKGYILPVFSKLNPMDTLYTTLRYGEEFCKLIEGKIETLDIDKIKNYGTLFNKRDILHRYDNIVAEKNNSIRYSTNICWMGVDSPQICKLLNTLFNDNIEEFNLSEVASKFDCDTAELYNYIENSMLFEKMNDEEILFRFIRKNILLQIKSNLLQSFENQLYNCSVIDTTATDYTDFKGTFKEYHNLGKIFKSDDTYSIKLISNLKNAFKDINYDRIILIDNGLEDDMRILLKKVLEKPISRIINNSGSVSLYPFDQYPFNENVLIVIDLCNKGQFLKTTFEFLSTELNSKVVGIFSFIIDVNFNVNECLGFESDTIFKYYIEKELDDINKFNQKKLTNRISRNKDERYLFFWDTINQIGDIKLNIFNSRARTGEYFQDIEKFETLYCQRIYLNNQAEHTIKSHSDLSTYIYTLIRNNNFKGCILNNTRSARVFSNILSRINNNIPTMFTDFLKPEDDIVDFYEKNMPLLIYDDGINLGLNILKILTKLNNSVDKVDRNVSVFILFSRKNMNSSKDYLSDRFFNEISQLVNKKLYIYYSSYLPYYLLNISRDIKDKCFKEESENIVERLE